MGRHRSTPSERFASDLEDIVRLYADDVTLGVKEAAREVARETSRTIKEAAPRRTGRYSRSWTVTETRNTQAAVEEVVHSRDRYQLAHLLEKGHAMRGGGRVSARVHIAPAEEWAAEKFEEAVREIAQNGGA